MPLLGGTGSSNLADGGEVATLQGGSRPRPCSLAVSSCLALCREKLRSHTTKGQEPPRGRACGLPLPFHGQGGPVSTRNADSFAPSDMAAVGPSQAYEFRAPTPQPQPRWLHGTLCLWAVEGKIRSKFLNTGLMASCK